MTQAKTRCIFKEKKSVCQRYLHPHKFTSASSAVSMASNQHTCQLRADAMIIMKFYFTSMKEILSFVAEKKNYKQPY